MKTADLRAAADARLWADDFGGALSGYLRLLESNPLDLDARLRVADALLALGEVQAAAGVYTAVARLGAHAGYPLRALVAMKVLEALSPELSALLGNLARLYGAGSPRLGRAARPSIVDSEGVELPEPDWEAVRAHRAPLVGNASRVGSDTAGLEAQLPDRLPPIPIFSALPESAFAKVLATLRLVRARPSQVLVREGDVGRSFYVLARGSVQITRNGEDEEPQRLATLHDGAIFGEMALVSSEPRSASVITITDCDVLEFDRDALEGASRDLEGLAQALETFARERLLANLLATSRLFQPLDPKQRLDLARRFTAHEVPSETNIIEEGQAGRGLFVLLRGEVDVWKRDGDEKVLLATLKPGEVFGEIALLHEGPTTATVTSARRSTVLFLAREYFQRLVEAVPEIRAYVESLGDERLMDMRLLLTRR